MKAMVASARVEMSALHRQYGTRTSTQTDLSDAGAGEFRPVGTIWPDPA